MELKLIGMDIVASRACWNMNRLWTNFSIQERVNNANIGKCTSFHHFVVTTMASIGVEVFPINSTLKEILGSSQHGYPCLHFLLEKYDTCLCCHQQEASYTQCAPGGSMVMSFEIINKKNCNIHKC